MKDREGEPVWLADSSMSDTHHNMQGISKPTSPCLLETLGLEGVGSSSAHDVIMQGFDLASNPTSPGV